MWYWSFNKYQFFVRQACRLLECLRSLIYIALIVGISSLKLLIGIHKYELRLVLDICFILSYHLLITLCFLQLVKATNDVLWLDIFYLWLKTWFLSFLSFLIFLTDWNKSSFINLFLNFIVCWCLFARLYICSIYYLIVVFCVQNIDISILLDFLYHSWLMSDACCLKYLTLIKR